MRQLLSNIKHKARNCSIFEHSVHRHIHAKDRGLLKIKMVIFNSLTCIIYRIIFCFSNKMIKLSFKGTFLVSNYIQALGGLCESQELYVGEKWCLRKSLRAWERMVWFDSKLIKWLTPSLKQNGEKKVWVGPWNQSWADWKCWAWLELQLPPEDKHGIRLGQFLVSCVLSQQRLGAAHSKCWLKSAYTNFLAQKLEKGRKRRQNEVKNVF